MSGALAVTDPGTRILNQASATYFSAEDNTFWTATSNIAAVQVTALHTGALEREVDLVTDLNEEVTISHLLVNTGNISTRYALSLSNQNFDDFDLTNAQVILDRNGNGAADPGEPTLAFDQSGASSAIQLNPGESVGLVLQGRTPSVGVHGMDAELVLRADIVDTAPGVRVDTVPPVTDTLLYEKPPRARLRKTASVPCGQLIAVGEITRITIDVSAAHRLREHVRAHQIGSESINGVMLMEEIAPLVQLTRSEGAPIAAPANAAIVASGAAVAGGAWRRIDDFPQSARIERLGMIIPEPSLRRDTEIALVYDVRALAELSVGAATGGAATVDYDGDDQADLTAPEYCVDDKTAQCFADAQLTFVNAAQTDGGADLEGLLESAAGLTPVFSLSSLTESGDGVKLLMRAPALNSDPAAVDSIRGDQAINAMITDRATGDAAVVEFSETGPNTGLFLSTQPLFLTEMFEAKEAACTPASRGTCDLGSAENSSVRASLTVSDCDDMLEGQAAVAPYGVVFDSTHRRPVLGATVAVRDSSGGIIATSQTDANGVYRLPALPNGDYTLDVTAAPNGYTFPSQVSIAALNGSVLVEGAMSGSMLDTSATTESTLDGRLLRVDGPSYGATGYRGSGGGAFTISAASPVSAFDIPLDMAFDSTGLGVDKEAASDTVAPGGAVRYTATVRNRTSQRVLKVVYHDQAPFGFAYVPGSFRLDLNNDGTFETTGVEPTLVNTREFTFSIGELAVGGEVKLDYIMRAGAGSIDGDGINTAHVTGESVVGVAVSSPRDTARVAVTLEGVLSTRGHLIGRIGVVSECQVDEDYLAYSHTDDLATQRYEDQLEDDYDREVELRYWPLTGARIWMETGVYSVTDERGYYSVYGVEPGSHVVRLDPETAPSGLEPAAFEAVAAMDGWTRFVTMMQGDLHRADFILPADCAQMDALREDILRGRDEARIEAGLEAAARRESMVDTSQTNPDRRAQTDGDVSAGLVGEGATQGRTVERGEDVFSPMPPRETLPSTEALAPTITQEQGREGVWFWPKTDVSRDGRFVAVVRSGVEPRLYVNDRMVDDSKLGERFENGEQRAQILAWYGVSLRPGENIMQVRAVDSFGNERVMAEKIVFSPGAPERLDILFDRESVMADGGRSSVEMTLRLTDENGAPVSGVSFATVSAEDGAWLDSDLNPDENGHQVRLDDGVARLRLASSHRAHVVSVRAETEEGFYATNEVRFISNDRPLVGVGLVSLSAHGLDRGAAMLASMIEPAHDALRQEREIQVNGRSALFLKGRIRGDMLLTLSYDSARDDRSTLFRDIDPNEYYPVYGDGSERGYEGQANSPLYVRIEKGQSSVMWGDFTTDHETDFRLSGLNRTLTGANARVEIGDEYVDAAITAFGARPRNNFVTSEIRGRGLAMGYQLPNTPIRRGTEKIEILTRDRINSGLTISERTLTRGVDYLIDYSAGTLDFYAPIPSIDDELNPVFIRASYDTEARGSEYTVAGARLELEDKAGAWRAGLSYTHVDEPGEENRMAGIYWEAKPFEGMRLRAEGAGTRGRERRRFSFGAYLEGELKFSDALSLEGSYARADADFKPETANIAAGRQEARVTLESTMDFGTARLEGVYSQDLETNDYRRSLGASLGKDFGEWRVDTGVRLEQQSQGSDEVHAIVGHMEVERGFQVYGRQAAAELRVDHAFDQSRTGVTGRLEIQLDDNSSAYVRHEFTNNLALDSSHPLDMLQRGRTAIGIETRATEDTTVYQETRLNNSDGFHTESVMGMRGDYEIMEGLNLQAQAESVETFRGDDSGDSLSGSLALTDNRDPDVKRSARIEARRSETDLTISGSAAVAARLSDGLTGLAGVDARYIDPQSGDANVSANVRLGAAWRPDENRTQVLAMYEGSYERNASQESMTHVASTHLNTYLHENVQLSGRAAVKIEDIGFDGFDFDSDAELLDARVVFGLHERLDLEVRGGLLSTGWGDSVRYSVGAGVTFALAQNVALGVGYNFVGFKDDDLDPQSYNAQGVYVRLNIAFDEALFDWLAPRGGSAIESRAPRE